ncbi:hypothetical protein [Sinomonas sp. B1-1]|uniref:aggregation-promoting factor C-terminal-like domain-containing protein n=1 Tax=Sinomonas sp. B1-1 TaxID=3141454 RepID=UPI003D2E1AA8
MARIRAPRSPGGDPSGGAMVCVALGAMVLRVAAVRVVAALVTAVLALALSGSMAVAADDAPPSGFPTWADVEAAKANAEAARIQADRISALLAQVKATAADASAAAVTAGAAAARAQQDVRSQERVVERLESEADRQATDRDAAQDAAGQLAAAAYMGGPGIGPFETFSLLSRPDSIDELQALQILNEQAAQSLADYRVAANAASAAHQAAQAARDELAQLAAKAERDLQAAQSAQRAAQRAVAEAQDKETTLLAQLADLKGTSADVERKYREGLEARAAYEAAQKAKSLAAQAQGALSGAALLATNPVSSGAGVVNDPAGAQAFASSLMGSRGWDQTEFGCLVQLWTRESNWLTDATNPSSGAYGIAQALPASKYASAGSDWLTNYRTQVSWGVGYIADRYGTPCRAWDHSNAVGWY